MNRKQVEQLQREEYCIGHLDYRLAQCKGCTVSDSNKYCEAYLPVKFLSAKFYEVKNELEDKVDWWKFTMDKCAYRYKIEEYEIENKSVPYDWSECYNCSGYPNGYNCANYTTLDELFYFLSYNLNLKSEESENQWMLLFIIYIKKYIL